jgi:hypothetical protein
MTIDMTQQLLPLLWLWIGMLGVGATAWVLAARTRNTPQPAVRLPEIKGAACYP